MKDMGSILTHQLIGIILLATITLSLTIRPNAHIGLENVEHVRVHRIEEFETDEDDLKWKLGLLV